MKWRAIRWRLVLPLVNVALAIGLGALGVRQYESDIRQHPGYFYHGNLYYLPSAQIVVYCLNMPAYDVSSAFAEFGIRYLRSDSPLFSKYSFFFVYWGFFVAVACFWYWIGYQFEKRSFPILANSTNISRYGRILAYIVGILLSLTMGYWGFEMRSSELLPRPIPIAELIWGVGLTAYFLILVYREMFATAGSR
jgi:hypothetical protein